MKTLAEWEASDLDLDLYLTEPCEIDEDLASYIGEVVAPVYVSPEFIQGGDPISEIPGSDGVLTYDTVSMIGDRYFYLGQLPEFKQ